ncbi:hypothetical protein Ct61P_06249 [Colletotrichum tofieldiae]|nr:hypothetical protein Ct61P_06249 [Colletotrichum tofieldiae]
MEMLDTGGEARSGEGAAQNNGSGTHGKNEIKKGDGTPKMQATRTRSVPDGRRGLRNNKRVNETGVVMRRCGRVLFKGNEAV